MKIGGISISGLCRLAPMASISNTPFRLICKEQGSSLTTSEEISAKALVYNSKKTLDLAFYLPEEKPIAMQIFGAEPKDLAEASKILVDRGADIIDLNMGCPVTKIVKTGAGAALMKDEKKAAEIFRAMVAAVPVPITIKIRGGWDNHNINAPQIACIAESEGISAIAVHPRTRSQQYTGKAPWEIIKDVVDAVSIPVTGNGDVKCYADAEQMVRETGCVSVMIGRAALGAPWIFNREFHQLDALEQHREKYKIIRRHFELIQQYTPERQAHVQMKKHLAWYTTGMRGGSKARAEIFQMKSNEEVFNFFEEYWLAKEPAEMAVNSSSAEPPSVWQ